MKILRTRKRELQGFSLLELLVAAALMAVIAGVVLAIASTLLQHWNRVAEAYARSAEAEAALDLLEQDLAGALLRAPDARMPVQWEAGPEGGFGESASLRFHSTSAGIGTEAGVVRAVAWYTATDAEGSSPFISDTVPSLFRVAVDPAETWSRFTRSELPAASDYAADGDSGLLLANCLSLQIEAWARRADGSLFPVGTDAAGDSPATGDQPALPRALLPGEPWVEVVYLDVSLRMIGPQAARVLARQRAGRGEIQAFREEEWIAVESEVFSRRISLGMSR